MNFHVVAVKDKSCTIRLWAKFGFATRASNKTCLNLSYFLIAAYEYMQKKVADDEQVLLRTEVTLN